MTEAPLLVENDGYVTWLTLNRPARLNALSDDLLEMLESTLQDLAKSDQRVIVLRGAGRAFCSGYDINPDAAEMGYAAERTVIEDRDRQLLNVERFTQIWRQPQPVIAAIHGVCAAGGTQLATLCDLTLVSDDALIMASPAIPIGGGFISPLWEHLVGAKRAKLMSFDAGRKITGKKANEWGWAAESFPPEDFDEEVRSTAHSIARTPLSLLKLKKEAVNRAAETSGLLSYARMGAETDALLHLTPEIAEYQSWIKDSGIKAAIKRFNDVPTGSDGRDRA